MILELNLFGEDEEIKSSETNANTADGQPQATDVAKTENSADDKNAEFEKLIKGDFREQFEQRIKENLRD